MKPRHVLFAVILGIPLLHCATADKVDLAEPKRVLGRENDVHVDAQIFAERIAPNSLIRVTYEIENLRTEPIAVADIIPEVEYEPESRMITISLGSEVPGNEMLPRLVRITAGERKSFTTGARISILIPGTGPLVAAPRFLQLKVNFLGQIEPFQTLIDIPEKAVRDPKLANELFSPWIEHNETVTTNAIPITWAPGGQDLGISAESGGYGTSRRAPRRPARPPGSPF